MFVLEIKIDFGSNDKAKDFFRSIEPELGEEFARSTTKVALRKSALEVFISASDKTALRASLHSLMKPLVLFNELGGL